MMAKAKLGILIDHSGVTSVSLLAGDLRGRREAAGLYAKVEQEIERFHCRILDSIRRECGLRTEGGASGNA